MENPLCCLTVRHNGLKGFTALTAPRAFTSSVSKRASLSRVLLHGQSSPLRSVLVLLGTDTKVLSQRRRRSLCHLPRSAGDHEEEGGLPNPHAGGELRCAAPPVAVRHRWRQGPRPGRQSALHAVQDHRQGAAVGAVVLQEGALHQQVHACSTRALGSRQLARTAHDCSSTRGSHIRLPGGGGGGGTARKTTR